MQASLRRKENGVTAAKKLSNLWTRFCTLDYPAALNWLIWGRSRSPLSAAYDDFCRGRALRKGKRHGEMATRRQDPHQVAISAILCLPHVSRQAASHVGARSANSEAGAAWWSLQFDEPFCWSRMISRLFVTPSKTRGDAWRECLVDRTGRCEQVFRHGIEYFFRGIIA